MSKVGIKGALWGWKENSIGTYFGDSKKAENFISISTNGNYVVSSIPKRRYYKGANGKYREM
jgi:hypothetical protein